MEVTLILTGMRKMDTHIRLAWLERPLKVKQRRDIDPEKSKIMTKITIMTVSANEYPPKSLNNHPPLDTVKKANVPKALYFKMDSTCSGTGDAICLSF